MARLICTGENEVHTCSVSRPWFYHKRFNWLTWNQLTCFLKKGIGICKKYPVVDKWVDVHSKESFFSLLVFKIEIQISKNVNSMLGIVWWIVVPLPPPPSTVLFLYRPLPPKPSSTSCGMLASCQQTAIARGSTAAKKHWRKLKQRQMVKKIKQWRQMWCTFC